MLLNTLVYIVDHTAASFTFTEISWRPAKCSFNSVPEIPSSLLVNVVFLVLAMGQIPGVGLEFRNHHGCRVWVLWGHRTRSVSGEHTNIRFPLRMMLVAPLRWEIRAQRGAGHSLSGEHARRWPVEKCKFKTYMWLIESDIQYQQPWETYGQRIVDNLGKPWSLGGKKLAWTGRISSMEKVKEKTRLRRKSKTGKISREGL